MQKYFESVVDRSGNAVVGASVLVQLGGVNATIYSDNGVTTQANPITTDNNGYFSFYAANGTYDLTVSGSNFATQSFTGIELFDPVDQQGAITSTGNILVTTAGNGMRVKEGSNAKQGAAVLVGGTVVVANTSVTANSRIFLTCQVPGGTPGFLRISARTPGVSFTILSSSGTDTSTVAFQIFEPA